MTVVLEAEAAPLAPALPQSAPHDAVEALEDIIAAHRQALVDLAPHQAWRAVRVDTGWHIAELGLLLDLRDQGGTRHKEGGGPQTHEDDALTRQRQTEQT